MILSGKEILKRRDKDIIIDPFDEKKINPNSYNLTLHNELMVYDKSPLDMKKDNPASKIIIPDDGTIDITYDAIKDGNKRQIKQKGTIIDKKTNADWTIQMRKPFIPFMKFAFKVVYLDEGYEYMAVGYPKNTMGWIMGRKPSVTDETIKSFRNYIGLSREK